MANKGGALKRAEEWTEAPFDLETRERVRDLIRTGSEDLEDRFYKDLSFGTGGMRGIMGVGTNRINRYTLGKATQALAEYLGEVFSGVELKVVIAYDCRHNSRAFARVVASVLSANGIKVYLFDDLRPTPELSFAVRYFGCHAGIVLTASHNPPEYNGYKVYFDDGGQIVPPHDRNIIAIYERIGYERIRFEANELLIEEVGQAVDEAFIRASIAHGTFDVIKDRSRLKLVFTPLHGTSIKLIPEVLKRAGYTDVHVVEQQAVPDGDFPTVASPNPEEPEALKMAMEMAEDLGADMVIGTDPDSDRIGIAVRNGLGELQLLTGNQTMCLMTDFLIRQWEREGSLNGKQFVASTIVSTGLMQRIADHYGVRCKIGLTGFKWIAKMIRDAEAKEEFIGGGEESFGYMVGDFVRDKDAVTASLLACEIAMEAKAKGMTIFDSLLDIYRTHGYHKEHLIAIVKKGKDGAERIRSIMESLRATPFEVIDGSPVCRVYDYRDLVCQDVVAGTVRAITDIPSSNVLIFETEDGTRLAARPSGTEPKIKFYIQVRVDMGIGVNVIEADRLLSEKIVRIVDLISY